MNDLDVFAGIEDETPADGTALRTDLLGDTLRGFCPLRKTFVQRPRNESSRASMLSALVKARQGRALKALLLLHALQPVLPGTPLPLSTWARMLSSPTRPCNSGQASEAFNALVHRNLATRNDTGQHIEVAPLLEDGSGKEFIRAGIGSDQGPGYFTIPHNFWTDGLVDHLNTPGIAMFLIGLHETTQHATFTMAVERAPAWYGVSERTAERGYQELTEAGLMIARRQMVRDARSPIGLRPVYHRALTGPYAMKARRDLQKAASAAVRKQRAKARRGRKATPARKRSSKASGR